jgi:hypothetical protein
MKGPCWRHVSAGERLLSRYAKNAGPNDWMSLPLVFLTVPRWLRGCGLRTGRGSQLFSGQLVLMLVECIDENCLTAMGSVSIWRVSGNDLAKAAIRGPRGAVSAADPKSVAPMHQHECPVTPKAAGQFSGFSFEPADGGKWVGSKRIQSAIRSRLTAPVVRQSKARRPALAPRCTIERDCSLASAEYGLRPIGMAPTPALSRMNERYNVEQFQRLTKRRQCALR